MSKCAFDYAIYFKVAIVYVESARRGARSSCKEAKVRVIPFPLKKCRKFYLDVIIILIDFLSDFSCDWRKKRIRFLKAA